MKKLILIGFLVLTVFALKAQKVYFIYLQAESGDPFFIRMNDRIYSSTASGYLILSKLRDSTYRFKLGFPGKDLDLNFTSAINKKDHGYLIKDFGEKGWGLFDLQTLSIQMASTNSKTTGLINNSSTDINSFTDLLSRAVDDPSLKQAFVFTKAEEKKPEILKENKAGTDEKQASKSEEKKTEVVRNDQKIEPPISKPEEKKTETIKIDQKVDLPIKPEEKKTEAVKTEQPEKNIDIPVQEEKYTRSEISKTTGNNTKDGVEFIFIDRYTNGNKDTIRIIIPADNKTAIGNDESKPDPPKKEKKFLDIITTDTVNVIDSPPAEIKKEEEKIKNTEEKKPFVSDTKTGCKSVALENDFLKLRRKMAGRTNDDGMIDEARKYFKTKCFTTEQIRNLSSMFLSSAGKYHFFDTAYGYVSDIENFPSLQAELKDEFYIDRFKSILRK